MIFSTYAFRTPSEPLLFVLGLVHNAITIFMLLLLYDFEQLVKLTAFVNYSKFFLFNVLDRR